MAFEFPDFTEMKLDNVSFRIEKHGDDDVVGMSAKLLLTGANTLLDAPLPGVRDALYMAVEGQDQLPGVERTTPKLRSKVITQATLNTKCEGWTVEIQYGIDEDDPILMGDVKIDKVTVTPMEGGTVTLAMRIGTNDVDAEDCGLLVSKMKQQVMVRIKAPQKKPDAIDGTVGHPGAAAAVKKAQEAGQGTLGLDDDDAGDDKDATAAFVAQGGDEAAPASTEAQAGDDAADAATSTTGADAPAADDAAQPAEAATAPAPAAKTAKARRKSTAQFIDKHASIE